VSGHEASLAVLLGWPLLAAFALVLVVGAVVKSRRLLVVGLVVVETLLVFWVYSLWQSL
jgi:hypothetical protein